MLSLFSSWPSLQSQMKCWQHMKEPACRTQMFPLLSTSKLHESYFLMKADQLWGADDMLSLIMQGWGKGPPTRDVQARGKSRGETLKKQQHKHIVGGPMGFSDEAKWTEHDSCTRMGSCHYWWGWKLCPCQHRTFILQTKVPCEGGVTWHQQPTFFCLGNYLDDNQMGWAWIHLDRTDSAR